MIPYAMATEREFDAILDVFQQRGLDLIFSIEDGADGDIEYHIHSHLGEVEAVLWSLQVVAGPEMVSSPGAAMPDKVEMVETLLNVSWRIGAL